MQFQLTILGCNSAIPANGRFPSAQVLNVDQNFYLIDCGEGTQIRLSENKISKNKIDQIFISHLHGDHIFGLIGLLSTMNLMGRTQKLQVFSPLGLKEVIDVQLHHTHSVLSFDLEFIVVDPTASQLIFTDPIIEVYSIPLQHRIPATGYLFKEKLDKINIRPEVISQYQLSYDQIRKVKMGEDILLENGETIPNKALTLPRYKRRSFAYCSDTTYQEAILPILKGVDLLYHESTFLHEKIEQAKITGHTTALEAGKLAAKAEVGQLILGHYSSRYKDLSPLLEEAQRQFANTQLGIEGQIYPVSVRRIEE